MKTEFLYYADVHETEFTGTVLSCEKDEKKGLYKVVLDRTAFFPEQGGQKADRGTLDGQEIVDVTIKNDVISHLVKEPVEEGKVISGSVDWERRFDFMQQHTGEHMLSGLVHKRFGWDNVGFHLSETETTLDFSGPVPFEVLDELETEVNRLIFKNLPVKVGFPEAEILKTLDYRSKLELTENVRIVEIPGVDMCACCAPHVDSTAQVGMLKIIEAQNYKGGVRLHIACGMRALKDMRGKQKNIEEISVLLSAKQNEVAEAVKRLKEKAGEADAQKAALGKKLLSLEAAMLPGPETSSDAVLFTGEADQNAMRQTVNGLMERYSGLVGVFSGNEESGWRFILGSSSIDCGALAGELRKKGFKCGGGKGFLQGSASGTEEALREVLECR